MRVLLQRASCASVTVEGNVVGRINRGLALFVGISREDTERELHMMADKISNLRIFPDEKGRFHLSMRDVKGGALLIPQFTLFADVTKGGRRPEFFGAMEPAHATVFFDKFVAMMKALEIDPVETGIFGAMMHVEVHNDGPVSIMLEVKNGSFV